jgi:hypothetical protein
VSEPPLLQRFAVTLTKRIAGQRRWESCRRQYWLLRHRLDDRAENRRWQVSSPRIVVASERAEVRHMYSFFLEWLGRERPALRRQIKLSRVPCAMPASTTLFHAWVQDPVIERDSQLYAELVAMERTCAERGIAVVHPAAVLSNSKRDVLCDRLRAVGLRTPRIVIADPAFDGHRGGLTLPMLVRRRWGHAADMRLLETEADFCSWWSQARSNAPEWVAGEYVDVRSPDGFYRKYRYVMAGSRGVARHLIVSPKWEVRPVDRVRTAATREEELAFVGSDCPHQALFDAARRALEFEIAAFDFSFDSAGQLVVWEVNPYPDLSTPAGEVGQYLRPAIERSYRMLADFYQERAGHPQGAVPPVSA